MQTLVALTMECAINLGPRILGFKDLGQTHLSLACESLADRSRPQQALARNAPSPLNSHEGFEHGLLPIIDANSVLGFTSSLADPAQVCNLMSTAFVSPATGLLGLQLAALSVLFVFLGFVVGLLGFFFSGVRLWGFSLRIAQAQLANSSSSLCLLT